MDPVSLARGIVTLLVPYLAKAGDVIAGKVGEATWEGVSTKVKAVHDAIRDKFYEHPYAAQTLTRLEERPEDEGRQIAVRALLTELLGEDSQLQAVLEDALAQAKHAGADSVIEVYGSGAAAIAGGVAAGKGGYAAGRDINVGSPVPTHQDSSSA
jgi:hypothetical protein